MGKVIGVPTYMVWCVAIGGKRMGDADESQAVEYGAINSKCAAELHTKYHYKNLNELEWPVVMRVRCPSGELHEITVRRVVEYDYKVSLVEQLEPPRRK